MTEFFVAIDSSIWIEVLREDCKEKLKTTMETLILEQKVAITPFTKLELLSGASNQAEFDDLKEDINALKELDLNKEIWDSASRMGFVLKRNGITVPNADLLLAAACMVHECRLWHQDQHFNLIAKHFDLRIFAG